MITNNAVYTDELEEEISGYIKEDVQLCVRSLLERFWITKEEEDLYYLIKDNEAELKTFFRETFYYRLDVNHELAKLEKIPVKTYNWMGDKKANPPSSTFQKQRDFVFLFCLLSFLEDKGVDDQFSLQNICEAIQIYYPQSDDKQDERVTIIWKEGSGYQNRLSLIRVLKYAIAMNLILVIDQYVDDFSGNSAHDVLFERTPYVNYFIRRFRDLFEWGNIDDFYLSLKIENEVAAKHRYYRRLFLEPIVYHDEITQDEQDYVKRFYYAIDNNVHRYTGYTYERYKHNSMLVKTLVTRGEVLHPTENMLSNLVLRFANYLLERPILYQSSPANTIDIPNNEMNNVLMRLKKEDNVYWSKEFKTMSSVNLRQRITSYLLDWNFAEIKDDKTITVKEGLFRIIGDYFNESSTK